MGNQLFQYATGRALSLRLNTVLKLDHSFLEADSKGAYTKRIFELDVFNCQQEKASAEDLRKVNQARRSNFFSRLFTRDGFSIVNEDGFAYNHRVAQVQGNVYLNGFWQSEKYFAGIRQTLLQELSLREPLTAAATQLKERILADRNSVSIHFRRGDYVKLQSAADFHGTAGMEYYDRALAIIRASVQDASCYIFSDEIDWVREHFRVPGAVYIAGLKGYEDLELMKHCRHHITANSSFSWWGAWLNPARDKVVVAPQKWFKDQNINTSDLIPKTWQKV